MSIVVVVGSDCRTLYQSPDPHGMLVKLSSFTNWQELVFGSVPLPTADQVGIKIHPGSITATSILFEYHPSPSTDGETNASVVIGVCVLWNSSLINDKHSHRVTCLLENLKSDVDRALRDNSLYLLGNLIETFVSRHEKSSLTTFVPACKLPSFNCCLNLLESTVGLNLVAHVLVNALISYYSPRRQKLILFTTESTDILQHLLFTIHHVISIISLPSDLNTSGRSTLNDPIFIQDDLDEKSNWFEEENVQNVSSNVFNRESCLNSTETQASSPAFLPEANLMGDRQNRFISSEEESLGYFSSSSSQGSTIAFEGCNSDDLSCNNEMDRDISSNLKSFDACRSDCLNRQGSVDQEDNFADSSVKSDGISSFQEVLREYHDIRFKANSIISTVNGASDGPQTSSSKHSTGPCFVAVKENNGFLHIFPQASSYENTSPAAEVSRAKCAPTGHSVSSCNGGGGDVVNLISNESNLLPHYLIQGLNMKKGDRVDNYIAYLSKCSCINCIHMDRNCTFKALDLDSLVNGFNSSLVNNNNQGFLLDMLRSILQLQKLGLNDDHLGEFICSKLRHELPLKAALMRSCGLSPSLNTSQSTTSDLLLEQSIYSVSQSSRCETLDASISRAESPLSITSLVNSLSLSTKKVTSSIKSAINSSIYRRQRRVDSPARETLPPPPATSCEMAWSLLGIHESDLELLASLPDTSLTPDYSVNNTETFETSI